jgi:hypothetical protein
MHSVRQKKEPGTSRHLMGYMCEYLSQIQVGAEMPALASLSDIQPGRKRGPADVHCITNAAKWRPG